LLQPVVYFINLLYKIFFLFLFPTKTYSSSMGIFKIQIAITPPTFTTVTPYLVYIFLTQGVLTYMHVPPILGRAYSKPYPYYFLFFIYYLIGWFPFQWITIRTELRFMWYLFKHKTNTYFMTNFEFNKLIKTYIWFINRSTDTETELQSVVIQEIPIRMPAIGWTVGDNSQMYVFYTFIDIHF
jgi:hypothetical protein